MLSYNDEDTNAGSRNGNDDFYSRISSSGAINKKCIFNTRAFKVAAILSFGLSPLQGFADEYSNFISTNTASFFEYSSSSKNNNSSNVLIRSVSEQISFIRSYLSLNISEASKIFGVQRPSIYAWISGQSSPSNANQERINLLYDLALDWKNKSNLPIGELRKLPVISNKSITDLLLQDDIDKASVSAIFSDLHGGKKDNLSNIQSNAYSIRQLAKEHGFEERSRDDKRRSFLLASSKK
jgi:hypothetical protein